MSQRQVRRDSFFREDFGESYDSHYGRRSRSDWAETRSARRISGSEESYGSHYDRRRHRDREETSKSRRKGGYVDSFESNYSRRRQNEWEEASDARRTHFRSRREDHSPCDNAAFQAPAKRTRIKPHELYKLKRGDHIGWHRPYIIWHHAIVVDVDVNRKRVKVIHYGKNEERETAIVEEWLYAEDQRGEMFRFEYSEEILCENSPEDVIKRARKKLGERGYQFLKNNCEHFATFCKTAKTNCMQVSWMRKNIVEAVDMAAYYGGEVAVAELLEDLIYNVDLFGAGLVVLLETGFCLYDIWQMNKKRRRGDISETDFKVSATQRVVEAGGSATLGSLGAYAGGAAVGAGCAYVGSAIGGTVGSVVPVVGTFIGSVAGGAIGCLIGKALGSLSGHWLGVKIFD